MTGALAACARHGRWLLVAGLVLGIALPPLARLMAGAIVPLIAFMLFLAGLRLGPDRALPPRRALPRALLVTLLLQTALPLLAGAALAAAGVLDSVAGMGIVLVLAAAPITGTVGLALMSGADGTMALRQLVLGTVLLPLTAAPVFALLPVFDGAAGVAQGALRLMAVIGLAGGAAVLARRVLPVLGASRAQAALDGLLALAMGAVVVGLMAAVGPAILGRDPALPGLLALAFALNLGLELGVWSLARGTVPASEAAALAIAAGNRNLALFLAALPPETATRLLLFVGCFQVPMYLTPLILPRLLHGRRT